MRVSALSTIRNCFFMLRLQAMAQATLAASLNGASAGFGSALIDQRDSCS
jgi:hypothetical protein